MKYYTILYYKIISTIRYDILDIKALWPDFGVEGGALIEEWRRESYSVGVCAPPSVFRKY